MLTPPGFVPGPLPSEARALEAGFQGYAGPPAALVSGDKWRYVAWLGSINGDKATFFVHCWRERAGVLEVITLANPPTNHAGMYVEDGKLYLMGVRGTTPDVWLVPGFVAPGIDQRARDQANAATEIAKNASEALKALAGDLAKVGAAHS